MFHDILQQPTLIASTEKYQQLVYDSTTELVQPIQCILSALDRRSMALSKCASYESALYDANLMQQLSSTSAIGYIREAMIYNEQGKQHDVIRICNQALSIVDTNDRGYDTLQQIKIHAQQRANRSVDFIGHLPIDILTTTLIPMLMDNDDPLDACEPCPYLHVSHLWRDRIMQHIDGLDFVIQERNEEDTFPQLIQFAQHTKSLCVKKYSQGTWLGDLLSSNDFCSLHDLSVHDFSSVDVDHFVSSLKHISNTLTELDLRLEDGPNLSLSTILMTCPNLTWLHMYAAHDVDLSSLPMTTWPNLTELYIKSTVNDITCDQIIGIWKRLPSLTTLHLHPCTDIQSTLVVTDYYPSMNYIGFDVNDSGIGFNVNDSGIELTFNRKGNPSDDIGITHLDLSCQDLEDDMDIMVDVNPMLRKHANTLQDLILKDFPLEMDLGISQDIHYPRLKKLYLDGSAWWIPRNAPMLQELTLTANTILEHPTVLDAIPANLKKLELLLIGGRKIADKAPIAAYLDGLAHQSQLKELVISSSRVDDLGNMFDAICHLDQLERLNVRIYGTWKPNHMEIFFGKLVIGCPRLCSLNISWSAPSSQCITILKQLEHLTQFGFWVDDIDNDERFWHEIQTFTLLKRITICDKENVNISSIRRLRRQRPDLQVIMGTVY